MVEVSNIVLEHALQMAFSEDQEMIQAFPTHTAQEPFTMGICFRSAIGDFQDFDAAIHRDAGKLGGEFAVVPGSREALLPPSPLRTFLAGCGIRPSEKLSCRGLRLLMPWRYDLAPYSRAITSRPVGVV